MFRTLLNFLDMSRTCPVPSRPWTCPVPITTLPPGTKQNLKIPFFANISRSTSPIWAIFFLFWRAQWELSNKKKMAQIWSLDHEINVKYLPGTIQFYEIFQEGYYTRIPNNTNTTHKWTLNTEVKINFME